MTWRTRETLSLLQRLKVGRLTVHAGVHLADGGVRFEASSALGDQLLRLGEEAASNWAVCVGGYIALAEQWE